MDKFGRSYELNVQATTGETITILPPLTIEFDITRNTNTSLNVCQIKIYNLSENNRNKLRKNVTDFGDIRFFSLRAGYGTNLPVIFTGQITQAWSVRSGQDFITQIECFDGGFAFDNCVVNSQFTANTPFATILKTIMGTLEKTPLGLPTNIQFGALGNYTGLTTRGSSYSGPPQDILTELTGGGFFIDNGKSYCLQNNEYLNDVEAFVISSDSGLLNTPVLQTNIVEFDMLFEPSLLPGRLARLDSITNNNINGDYVISSVKHRGMISEAVCGDCITTGGFFFIQTPIAVEIS